MNHQEKIVPGDNMQKVQQLVNLSRRLNVGNVENNILASG